MNEVDNFLEHHGVKGMKWGVRKAPEQLSARSGVSSTTKRVINDYNSMDNKAFRSKYKTTKSTYAKRVKKYGDPYKNAPLAKLGKKLEAKQKKKASEISAATAKRGQAAVTPKLTKKQISQIKSGEVSFFKADGTPVKMINFF